MYNNVVPWLEASVSDSLGTEEKSANNGLKEVSERTKEINPEKFLKTNRSSSSLFKVQSANVWMEKAKQKPIPQKLFDEFWFEGEVSILFADTNVGKSILAVQIADSISRGEPIRGFELSVKPQTVICFDFELSDKQFENRYSMDYSGHYQFNDNFLRAEIDPDGEIPDRFESFDEYLIFSIEQEIERTGATKLIVDNITYLRSETEQAKNASPLMKRLKELKSKYGLSILVLAHTPKRDMSKILTSNDLAGSRMLMNFCDSSFTIGFSNQAPDIRYVKQIKARNAGYKYSTDNVCVCRIGKPNNFLQFELVEYGSEQEHLKERKRPDKDKLAEEAKQLKEEGLSQRAIAAKLDVALGTVNGYLKS